jgi:hypothetical protein
VADHHSCCQKPGYESPGERLALWSGTGEEATYPTIYGRFGGEGSFISITYPSAVVMLKMHTAVARGLKSPLKSRIRIRGHQLRASLGTCSSP